MLYTDEVKFDECVGTICSSEDLLKIGAPAPDEDTEDSGRYGTDRLQDLIRFVAHNTQYHIITDIDSEDDDDGNMLICMCNRICYVNRNAYLLGYGDNDPDIYLEEVLERGN